MTGRVLFKTLWPVLRRGSGCVQFGTDPGHAVVLEGLSRPEVEALEQLDGTRDLPVALRTTSGRELLELLAAHRLVIDADVSALPVEGRRQLAHEAEALLRLAPGRGRAPGPTHGYAVLADRAAAHLLVVGQGELPRAVADQLRRAGVGSVWQGAAAGDDWAVADADRTLTPALVVVIGRGAVDPAAGAPWRARGIPVLPVVLHGLESAVGPVVEPGGPCLRCLDLARADLDPGWPALLGQLVPVVVGAGPEVSGETSLVAVTAAATAMVALSVLAGQPLPTGRSLEFALPWPAARQRQWTPHPRCGCGAGSGRSRRPADGETSAQVRMAG
ncbi:hypothetical protein [Pedococcus dokdonensis]|uniref:hypothetical protein n=1 Tax=Pedococcus dokdonensis TaxID=443156 RepID=UPI0012FE6834|nr:hypothetical protein [Pedococcus dokdonensis]